MSDTWTFDQADFNRTLRMIAELSRKGVEYHADNQAKLLVQDANGFTPPHGKAPIKEGGPAKKRIGMDAVAGDIRYGFMSVEKLRLYPRIKKLAKQGNTLEIGRILKLSRYKKVIGVLTDLDPERHKQLRNKRGRVPKSKCWILLKPDSVIQRYIKKVQGYVGIAKHGWSRASKALGAKEPSFSEKQTVGQGVFYRTAGDTPGVTVGNGVQYVQWREPEITSGAWENRVRNARKELIHMQRWAHKRAKELKLV